MARTMYPKDAFFNYLKKEHTSVTFKDVKLETGYSEVLPKDVETKTRFSRNIPLNIPIVSAAMDTITEHKMAIELAKLGGIGIIHRNLSIEDQASEVTRTKFGLLGCREPICIHESQKVDEVLKMRNEKGYTFHSFPVLNNEGRLVGIVTENDFDFNDDPNALISTIMSKGLITGTSSTSREEAYSLMKEHKIKVIPLIDAEKKIKGLYLHKGLQDIMTGRSEMYNVDSNGQLRVGAAIGVGEEALERVEKLYSSHVDVIVIDTAHADTKTVFDTLKEIKRNYGIDVVVGNISSPGSAKRLIEAGADGIKIGQGGGSICTTRIVLGIGKPQLSAVYECSVVADNYNIPVCSDGGAVYSGDLTLAIAAGAHSVMLGNMLAGTDETPGEVIKIGGKPCKYYRGMGSLDAMEESKSSRERYVRKSNDIIPEGIDDAIVEYKGPLEQRVKYHIGGLKGGMAAIGAKNIDELRTKAEFNRLSPGGVDESHPHDLIMTREPPNYTPPKK